MRDYDDPIRCKNKISLTNQSDINRCIDIHSSAGVLKADYGLVFFYFLLI